MDLEQLASHLQEAMPSLFTEGICKPYYTGVEDFGMNFTDKEGNPAGYISISLSESRNKISYSKKELEKFAHALRNHCQNKGLGNFEVIDLQRR